MDIEASVERYVEALSLGISQAEEKRREKKDEHENREWVYISISYADVSNS